jgi:transcriptional regulator with XRE-family HTH domain
VYILAVHYIQPNNGNKKMNKNQNLTPDMAKKLRSQMGLSQRAVSMDLRERTNNLLKIDNTKLSRFERGEITLDNQTLELLKKYLNDKAAEFGLIELDDETEVKEVKAEGVVLEGELEGSEFEIEPELEEAVIDKPIKDQAKVKNTRLKQTPSETSDLFNIEIKGVMFSKALGENEKDALLSRLTELEDQLDESLNSDLKRGFFGSVTDTSKDDAKAILFAMAGCYNIIRALKGNSILPVGDSETDTVEETSLLHVLAPDWNAYTGQTKFIEHDDGLFA